MLVSKENSSSCSTLKVLLSLPSLVEDIVKLQECYRVFHYKKDCKKTYCKFQEKVEKQLLSVQPKLKLFLWMPCAKFIQFQLFLVKLFEF